MRPAANQNPFLTLEKVSQLFIPILLLVLPLFIIPWAKDSYVLPKEVLLQVAGILSLLLIGVRAFSERDYRLPLYPINLLFAGLVLLSWLSITWSAAPRLAFEESIRYTAVLSIFLFFQSMALGDRGFLLRCARLLSYATLLVAVFTVQRDFRYAFFPASLPGIRQVLGDWRDNLSQIFFGNTSHLADFLVAGFFLWLARITLARKKTEIVISTLALLLHAAALIVSWSVHSNLSLILGSVLLLFVLRHYSIVSYVKKYRRRYLVLLAGWIFVVLFYVFDHPINPHGSQVWEQRATQAYAQAGQPLPEGGFGQGIFGEAFSSPRWVAGLDTRLAIWLTTLEMVRVAPWVGHGAGNFTYVYPETRSELLLQNENLAVYSGMWTNAAHQDLLQVWAELGIGGLLLLLALFAAAFKMIHDRLSRGVTFGNAILLATGGAMLFAQLMQMQMNFPLELPVSLLIFALLLSFPFILPGRGEEATDLNVPVERVYGPMVLGVSMKNMAWPTELSIRFEFSQPLRLFVLLAFTIVAAFGISRVSRPLAADIVYRPVYDAKQQMRMGASPILLNYFFAGSSGVLETWPHHVDCRSSYQDALLNAGRFEDVVDQTPLVLEKLNSIEVYMRRARALTRLERYEEARTDWEEVLERRPEIAQSAPPELGAYLGWLQNTSN